MLLAVSQLLARALTFSLIAVSVGQRYVILAVVLEVGLFFVYKLIRQDFYYSQHPKVTGFPRIILSAFSRFTCKIIVDFTR
jgi:hypothetical protein